MVEETSSVQRVQSAGGFRVERFSSIDPSKVVHGITTRTPDLPYFGNMSYMVGEDKELVRESRSAWANAIGFDHERLVLGHQVHGTTVIGVDHRDAGKGSDSVDTAIRKVDGLMTSTPGVPIGVMAADCVPILIYDPRAGAVAAVHAGWRGTVDGIAVSAVQAMQSTFGSGPEHLVVGLGPSICAECYEVGDEVIERWRESDWSIGSKAVSQVFGRFHFDLRTANIEVLLGTGVSEVNIELSEMCTRCSNGATFSRRGLGPRTGLFSAIIMLKPRCKEEAGVSH